MTLTELKTQLANLNKFDLDNVLADQSTGVTSDANLVAQLNEAAELLSKRLWVYDPKVTWTQTASTKNYALDSISIFSKRLWDVSLVIVNEYPLYNCARTQYGFWSMDELDACYPGWRTGAASTPVLAVRLPNTLLVYPSPDATCVATGNNYVAGLVLQSPLTNTVDDAKEYSDIPRHLHKAIAYLAAGLASSPVASEASAWARIAYYDKTLAREIDEMARQNRNMIAVPGTMNVTPTVIKL